MLLKKFLGAVFVMLVAFMGVGYVNAQTCNFWLPTSCRNLSPACANFNFGVLNPENPQTVTIEALNFRVQCTGGGWAITQVFALLDMNLSYQSMHQSGSSLRMQSVVDPSKYIVYQASDIVPDGLISLYGSFFGPGPSERNYLFNLTVDASAYSLNSVAGLYTDTLTLTLGF